ncbi:MAG: hypothetical protein LBV72_08495 [Tannerella sp.]|jgi:hypothetical protein|nr:hypothetical protein [Tannerella sp.]
MHKIFIIAILSLYSGIFCQGQKTNAIPFEEISTEEPDRIVAAIDTMSLTCDTFYLVPYYDYIDIYDFACIYFDNKGQLRKYSRQLNFNDGGQDHIDFSAYYDLHGDLVYITYQSGNNCEDDAGYFYVHQGHIVGYDYDWDCGCCEDDVTEEDMSIIRPEIGAPLEKTVDENWSLKRFISARTLLETIHSPEYGRHDEFDE